MIHCIIFLVLSDIERPKLIGESNSGRINIEKGIKYTIDCHVAGVPAPKIEWYKDGILIPGDNVTMGVLISPDNMR